MKKYFIVLTLSLVLAASLCGCLQWLEIPDEHYSQASAELINENASDNARELMRYLKSIYGKNTLAAAYDNPKTVTLSRLIESGEYRPA